MIGPPFFPQRVSVPSRGTGNINSSLGLDYTVSAHKFPSPLGEQGISTYRVALTVIGSKSRKGFRPPSGNSEYQHTMEHDSHCKEIAFPSPLGEQGISTRMFDLCSNIKIACFRPLSGNREYQPAEDAAKLLEMRGVVSVPSRGTGNINLQPNQFIIASTQFPSPLGEQGISTWRNNTHAEYCNWFPSPLGEQGIST